MILFYNTSSLSILLICQILFIYVDSLGLKRIVNTFYSKTTTKTRLLDISKAIHREDFPILDVDVYPEKKLVYLDSAASSQKPIQVLNKVFFLIIFIEAENLYNH